MTTVDKKLNIEDTINQVSRSASDIDSWLEGAKNGDLELNAVAVGLFHLKNQYKELDAQRKRIYHAVDALEKFLVPKMLDDAGLDMVRVPEIARSFSIRDMLSASMLDKEKGFKWLRAEGHGDLIQETVNAGTLASFAKNLLVDEGIDLPEDIFKITTYKTTGMNKYTPK